MRNQKSDAALSADPTHRTVTYVLFERLLTPGCVELPTCQCGEAMEITGITEFPTSRDAVIRVYTCPACKHEMRLTVWALDQAA